MITVCSVWNEAVADEAEPVGGGDPLAACYDAHAEALFRIAQCILHDAHAAEDAVHDVFVALARSGTDPRTIDRPRPYLITALRRDIARRIQRRERLRLVDREPPEQASGLQPEADEALEAALDSLPVEQREVVALKIDGDLTFAEIAEQLAISPNTAASRYRYALQHLRDRLGKEQQS